MDPLDRIDRIDRKVNEGMDNFAEPLREWFNEVSARVDRGQETVDRLVRTSYKISVPVTSWTNPVGNVIVVKNMKKYPDKSMDEIMDISMEETFDWLLTGLNIAWPGTAAPNAKEEVKEKVGGLLEEATGVDLFGTAETVNKYAKRFNQ